MFVGHWADLTDTRMPPTAIIIHHPPVNSQIQLSPGGECVTIVVFMFEGRPERFRARIIPTDASPTHGLAEPRFLAFIRHVPAGILSTPIVAIQLGVRAGGSQGPVVKSSVSAWYLSLPHLWAVSYTHLRAHETVLDLVCRLLLE